MTKLPGKLQLDRVEVVTRRYDGRGRVVHERTEYWVPPDPPCPAPGFKTTK